MMGSSNRNTPHIRARRKRLVLGLAAILGVGGLVETSMATTRYVTTCNDGPDNFNPRATWLRQQVSLAQSGDTIDMTGLTCSTITLTHGAIPITVANLDIEGPTGHALTIDGNNQDRVFNHTGYSLNHINPGFLKLHNMTITHGMASGNGGCIQSVRGGTVVLVRGVTVAGCSASGKGGGIAAPYVLTYYPSTISNNAGGGIYVSGTRTGLNLEDAYIANTTISGNTNGAGLIGSNAGYLKIVRSTITNNASNSCGGIDAGTTLSSSGTSKVDLSYSNVVGNSASQSAGGICAGSVQLFHASVSSNKGSTGGILTHSASGGFYDLDAEESTIAGNTGYVYSGGVDAGHSFILNSTISGNVATSNDALALSSAAGIGTYTGLLVNSTISGNQGQQTGGVVVAIAKLFNSTVAFNTSNDLGFQYPGGIKNGGFNCSASCSPSLAVYSSIVANNVSGVSKNETDISSLGNATLNATSSLIMGSNKPVPSITADPLLLPLGNNGGSVLTHALGAYSPALGVGSNPKNLGTDERGPGFPRTWANGKVDIGAFQSVDPDEIFKNGFEVPQ